jgi:hypothetical protein
MAKYLLVYHGGTMPEAAAEIATIMQAWQQWFDQLAEALIDGGNPVGLSTTINSDGSITHSGGANPASGYSLIAADSVADALAKAKGCPILAVGGNIEVAEVIVR